MKLPDLFTEEEEKHDAEQRERERSLLSNPKKEIPARQYGRTRYSKDLIHRGAAFRLLRQQELAQKRAVEANAPQLTEEEQMEILKKEQQKEDRAAR